MSRTPDPVPPPTTLDADAPVGPRRSLVPWLVAAIATAGALWLARQNLALNAELDTQSLAESETQLRIRALHQQLEAEQLLGRGEIARLRQAQAGTDPARMQVTLLAPPAGAWSGPRAVVLWNLLTSQGVLVATGLPPAALGEEYRLWFAPVAPQAAGAVGPASLPLDGGGFTVDPATGEARHPFKTTGRPPAKFMVTRAPPGGAPPSGGPVVLTGP